MELFNGDHSKVKQLDQKIAEKMGFAACFPVSGQTYPRKVDSQVLSVLSGIAQSAAKFSSDLRLLQHLKEVEEPFEKNQIGSSAMAYKRNPMRSERIASLARYVVADTLNPAMTASTNGLSARLTIPQTNASAWRRDSWQQMRYWSCISTWSALVVYPKVIEKR